MQGQVGGLSWVTCPEIVCRKYHEKYGQHHYFLSWRESWNKFEDWDWFNARNFCRERCMDLVSFEDPEEYRHFAKMMHRGGTETCVEQYLTVCLAARQHQLCVHQRQEVQLPEQGL